MMVTGRVELLGLLTKFLEVVNKTVYIIRNYINYSKDIMLYIAITYSFEQNVNVVFL